MTETIFIVSTWWWLVQKLLFILTPQQFTHHCFCIISASVNAVTKANSSFALFWQYCWSKAHETVSGVPQGTDDYTLKIFTLRQWTEIPDLPFSSCATLSELFKLFPCLSFIPNFIMPIQCWGLKKKTKPLECQTKGQFENA